MFVSCKNHLKSAGSAFLALLAGAALFGCSASTGTPTCPTNQIANADGKCVPRPPDMDIVNPVDLNGPVVDMTVTVLPDLLPSVAPDLFQGLPFGSPCDDNSICASSECLLSGTGGVCTQMCATAADCPNGWGCYGVAGVDGTVTNLCVMEHDQLCNPCRTGADCSSTEEDLCLPYTTGGSFCARDCTTISCPTGYSCQTVINVPGDMAGTAKQCVPQSGAVRLQLVDHRRQESVCSITTSLGTQCPGTRTCQGSTGWSSCAPPSLTDVPDDSYSDSNCDGIDGDITAGIFVAQVGGLDLAGCGTNPGNACQSIGVGLLRAGQAPTKPYVYVQAGTYNEELLPTSNVTIVGGYDTNWQRGPYGAPSHTVRITGNSFDVNESQYITVKVHGVTNATLMEMEVIGISADARSHPGLGSYAVHIAGSTGITLHNIGIIAGNGAKGSDGTPGTPASSTAATASMKGGQGGNAVSYGDFTCSTARPAAGTAGTNNCPDNDPPNGGAGGAGGDINDTKDFFGICTASPHGGLNGSAAAYATGSPTFYGQPGGGGPTNNATVSCNQPTPGGTGDGGRAPINGGGGAGASSALTGGELTGNYGVGVGGSSGFLGSNGTGGGGGGGGGGSDVSFSTSNESGGGGGGGGAGGCRARAAGGPGAPGGGSFGIFVVNSTSISVTGGAIQIGTGGPGGTGGAGALGQGGRRTRSRRTADG